VNVNAGARAFLAGLIDYAGLFPPAALEMAPALAEYARHRDGAGVWMLGRFVVPAARLEALTAALAAGAAPVGDQPWSLAVLVSGGADLSAALGALPAQVDSIVTCEQAGPGGLTVDVLETPLPAGAGAAPALAAALADEGLDGRDLYLEIGADADAEAALDDIAAAAAAWGGAQGAFPKLGAKLRCGGMSSEAFPVVERVAAVISGCARRDLPLKFTAGLHHPVRRYSDVPAVMMYGFLNVIGAALLAFDRRDDPALLAACLAETDPAVFRLDDSGFGWREHVVTTSSVARSRAGRVAAFGSCSFDEPSQDLAALGLF
jgi:hypothetical protein